MTKRKLRRPHQGRSRTAMALALVGTLFASMGVVLMGATAANAADEPCPDGVDGWTKINSESGHLIEQSWGDIWWGDPNGTDVETSADQLKYDITSNYSLDLCIKSGQNAGGAEGDEKRVFRYGLTGTGSVTIGQAISHIAYRVGQTVAIPSAQVPVGPTCETPGSYTLPADTNEIDWSISPEYDGVGDYVVKATTKNGLKFTDNTSEKTWNVAVLPATGDCGGKTIVTPTAPTVTASFCRGAVPVPAEVNVPADVPGIDYEPNGANSVTATINLDTHEWGTLDPRWAIDGATATYTFDDTELAPANCDTTTTTNVSDERMSCAVGVERRTGTVTTINGQAQPAQWGPWQVVRGLSDAEFEQRGCRPDQPEPAVVLGSETRLNCVGLQERSSSQVTSFEWNASTREYETVVGDTIWTNWKTLRKLTTAELKAEGCVLGEETLVPSPKPDKKPTVKGVERVAPPAAVPTAVAAGAVAATPSTMTQLLAQLLVGGGMLLLLAGGWIGFSRREGGAHEA